LTLSPYEYPQQYARFEVGDVLCSVNEIADIPARLANFSPQEAKQQSLWKIDPEMLRQLLGAGSPRETVARRVS
jgi:hypothetical protein